MSWDKISCHLCSPDLHAAVDPDMTTHALSRYTTGLGHRYVQYFQPCRCSLCHLRNGRRPYNPKNTTPYSQKPSLVMLSYSSNPFAVGYFACVSSELELSDDANTMYRSNIVNLAPLFHELVLNLVRVHTYIPALFRPRITYNGCTLCMMRTKSLVTYPQYRGPVNMQFGSKIGREKGRDERDHVGLVGEFKKKKRAHSNSFVALPHQSAIEFRRRWYLVIRAHGSIILGLHLACNYMHSNAPTDYSMSIETWRRTETEATTPVDGGEKGQKKRKPAVSIFFSSQDFARFFFSRQSGKARVRLISRATSRTNQPRTIDEKPRRWVERPGAWSSLYIWPSTHPPPRFSPSRSVISWSGWFWSRRDGVKKGQSANPPSVSVESEVQGTTAGSVRDARACAALKSKYPAFSVKSARNVGASQWYMTIYIPLGASRGGGAVRQEWCYGYLFKNTTYGSFFGFFFASRACTAPNC